LIDKIVSGDNGSHASVGCNQSVSFNRIFSIHRHIAMSGREYAKRGGRVQNVIWTKDSDWTWPLVYRCIDCDRNTIDEGRKFRIGERLCSVADRKPTGKSPYNRVEAIDDGSVKR
jgi:hypothetical protein